MYFPFCKAIRWHWSSIWHHRLCKVHSFLKFLLFNIRFHCLNSIFDFLFEKCFWNGRLRVRCIDLPWRISANLLNYLLIWFCEWFWRYLYNCSGRRKSLQNGGWVLYRLFTWKTMLLLFVFLKLFHYFIQLIYIKTFSVEIKWLCIYRISVLLYKHLFWKIKRLNCFLHIINALVNVENYNYLGHHEWCF